MERNSEGVERAGLRPGGGTKGKRPEGEGEERISGKGEENVSEVHCRWKILCRGGEEATFWEDAVAVELEERDCGEILKNMGFCLVGEWRAKNSSLFLRSECGSGDEFEVGSEGEFLGLAKLEERRFLLEFALREEKVWVLQKGDKDFHKFMVDLDL